MVSSVQDLHKRSTDDVLWYVVEWLFVARYTKLLKQ